MSSFVDVGLLLHYTTGVSGAYVPRDSDCHLWSDARHFAVAGMKPRSRGCDSVKLD